MSNIITNKVSINRNGTTSALFMTADSGKIIYRDKIDTLIGIKHPGIILGSDAWGTVWVIHNHYQIGYPQIVTFESFGQGNAVFYDNRSVFYSPIEVIERAISHWIKKKEYSWLFYNCQHFVNRVTQNDHYSESVEQVTDTVMATGGILAFIGLLAGDKGLLQTGLGIVGAGATGKFLNRA